MYSTFSVRSCSVWHLTSFFNDKRLRERRAEESSTVEVPYYTLTLVAWFFCFQEGNGDALVWLSMPLQWFQRRGVLCWTFTGSSRFQRSSHNMLLSAGYGLPHQGIYCLHIHQSYGCSVMANIVSHHLNRSLNKSFTSDVFPAMM